MGFYEDIKSIVNIHGIDQKFDISDQVIATYIMECLTSLDRVYQARVFSNSYAISKIKDITDDK